MYCFIGVYCYISLFCCRWKKLSLAINNNKNNDDDDADEIINERLILVTE